MKENKDKLLEQSLDSYADGFNAPPDKVASLMAMMDNKRKNLQRTRAIKNKRLFAILTPIISFAIIIIVAVGSIGGFKIFFSGKKPENITMYSYSQLYVSRNPVTDDKYLNLNALGETSRSRTYHYISDNKEAFNVTTIELSQFGGYDIVYLIAECGTARGDMFINEYGLSERLSKRYEYEKGEYYSRYSFTKEEVQYYVKIISSYEYSDKILAKITQL